ncbi:hypothetical protein H5410_039857, partial [Solanum commersonii]
MKVARIQNSRGVWVEKEEDIAVETVEHFQNLGMLLVFLKKVLRKMGLSDRFVVMVWRLISNNYYSILLN